MYVHTVLELIGGRCNWHPRDTDRESDREREDVFFHLVVAVGWEPPPNQFGYGQKTRFRRVECRAVGMYPSTRRETRIHTQVERLLLLLLSERLERVKEALKT